MSRIKNSFIPFDEIRSLISSIQNKEPISINKNLSKYLTAAIERKKMCMTMLPRCILRVLDAANELQDPEYIRDLLESPLFKNTTFGLSQEKYYAKYLLRVLEDTPLVFKIGVAESEMFSPQLLEKRILDLLILDVPMEIIYELARTNSISQKELYRKQILASQVEVEEKIQQFSAITDPAEQAAILALTIDCGSSELFHALRDEFDADNAEILQQISCARLPVLDLKICQTAEEHFAYLQNPHVFSGIEIQPIAKTLLASLKSPEDIQKCMKIFTDIEFPVGNLLLLSEFPEDAKCSIPDLCRMLTKKETLVTDSIHLPRSRFGRKIVFNALNAFATQFTQEDWKLLLVWSWNLPESFRSAIEFHAPKDLRHLQYSDDTTLHQLEKALVGYDAEAVYDTPSFLKETFPELYKHHILFELTDVKTSMISMTLNEVDPSTNRRLMHELLVLTNTLALDYLDLIEDLPGSYIEYMEKIQQCTSDLKLMIEASHSETFRNAVIMEVFTTEDQLKAALQDEKSSTTQKRF